MIAAADSDLAGGDACTQTVPVATTTVRPRPRPGPEVAESPVTRIVEVAPAARPQADSDPTRDAPADRT
jgi:hypothetical protein